ncbi:hypothetical protein EAG18_08400 [Pseudoalteromonas sp. J010]|uniref:Uncharacterized protein n=2 Tax=Pseudoalteromonas TaxID=53246 RepID=A0A8I0MYX1_9GAMM|nr:MULTISPECIES: hypothetical protein [Pseudoalteromonas]MBE0347892.1 hypothetical protein [Pseudoalteromonas peptidolytica F12-50-A1]NLR15308.1 hypothetical protein [Pseudoalteromonas peptidolytica]RRS09131.1 hypothetical protein EAG18_08400 [Pseudoalteromonas sp. J010]GEK08012.1 hypothetical protein PPE03_02610 [Pseudoalteromonas peptidolytica]
MITVNIPQENGQYQSVSNQIGDHTLHVVTPTFGKSELLVYVDFNKKNLQATGRIKIAMQDPNIAQDTPFDMCQLVNNSIVPMEINIVQSGQYRFPIPVGSNEVKVKLSIELADAHEETDSLALWVAANSDNAVSVLK